MAADDQDFVVLDKSDILDFNDAGLLPLSNKEISKIQAWLKPTDYAAGSGEYAKHKASHLTGTGNWILDTDEYRRWHDSDQGTLWISAIAGAGKSVLAAFIISKIMSDEQVPVLFFFFRHIISTNQKPQFLIRDYLSQILPNSPWLQHHLYKLMRTQSRIENTPLQELWNILVTTLTLLPRVYCVVDALDEMESHNRPFLEDLVRLGQKTPCQLKLLMTSRPVPRIEQVLQHPDVLQIRLQPRLTSPDISVYVRHRINECLISDRIRHLIHQRMCQKADGHFLYARLMMDDLLDPSKNTLAREDGVLSVLDSLPTPMADMYTKMLLDHARRSHVAQEVQLTILYCITRAERPLRLLELCSIFDVKQKAIETSKDIKSIVREACGPLIEVFEDETVHPIHHSFTEYLYDENRQAISPRSEMIPVLNYIDAQRTLCLSCIRYLASVWSVHSKEGGFDVSRCNKTIYQQSLKMRYPFLSYATSNLCDHLRKYDSDDLLIHSELDAIFTNNPDFLKVWLELIKARNYVHDYWSDEEDEEGEGGKRFENWTALHAAAYHNLTQYVRYLLTKGHRPEDPSKAGPSPVGLATKGGHAQVVEALLNAGAKYDQYDDLGMTLLHHAASENHSLVAELLLRLGADPFAKWKEDYDSSWDESRSAISDTPVEYACREGHLEVMQVMIPYLDADEIQDTLQSAFGCRKHEIAEMLLRVPDLDVNLLIEGRTLFYLATEMGDLDLMRLLISRGISVYGSPQGEEDTSLLNVFACNHLYRNHGSIIEWSEPVMKEGLTLLLDAGADPNFVASNGQSIVQILLADTRNDAHRRVGHIGDMIPREGVDALLRLLLERGLSPTLLSDALHHASRVPTEVINLLLRHGADINHVCSSTGATPLISAVQRGDFGIAQCLIDRGARVDVTDWDHNSLLHHVAMHREYQIDYDLVEALILAGLDIHGKNKDGDTPIHCGDFNPKLLSIFLEHKFNLESKNRKGYTVLHQCMPEKLYLRHHEKLIDLGANPLTQDLQGRNVLHTILRYNPPTRNAADQLKYFIQKGVNPCATDNLGNTLWHCMASTGAAFDLKPMLAVFSILIKYNVPPVARNYAGQLPIHAVFSNNMTNYLQGQWKVWLEHAHANINSTDGDGLAPVHLVASFDTELTHQLLKLGADPTIATVEGQTTLMVACRNRQCNTVCMIIDYYRDHDILSLIDQVDRAGRSALHYACKSGRPESVAALVDAGAQVKLKDKNGNTPLDLCSEYLIEDRLWFKPSVNDSRLSVMKATNVLLHDTARPRLTPRVEKQDPIRIREAIRLLIANGADVSFLTKKLEYDKKDCLHPAKPTPLSLSIIHRCEAMTSELLRIQGELLRSLPVNTNGSSLCFDIQYEKIKENINTANLKHIDASYEYDYRIYLARQLGGCKMVGELSKPLADETGLLYWLLEREDEPAIIKLKDTGTDFTKVDRSGHSQLHTMVSLGYTDLVRQILRDVEQMVAARAEEKLPQNVELRLGGLKNILYSAISRELPNLEMLKLLVTEFKFDVNAVPPAGPLLHKLADSDRWWHAQALEFLLKHGAKVEMRNHKGQTALIVALMAYRANPVAMKTIEILLRHGANPNATDEYGGTCLDIAGTHLRYIELLLDYGAEPNSTSPSFIFNVIKTQNSEILQHIVDVGIEANCRYQGAPLVPSTTASGNNHVSKRGRHHLSLDELCTYAYPIHVAASSRYNSPEMIEKALSIIELLLQAGANPFLIYEDGASILHELAEDNGILGPFTSLPGFDPEVRDLAGRTPFIAACDSRDLRYQDYATNTWDVLLESGCSVTATDNAGRSALHHLLRKERNDKQLSLTRNLIPQLVSMADNQGRSPLHYALSARRFDLLDDLLNHGADPSMPDPRDGTTALHHLAFELAHIEHEMKWDLCAKTKNKEFTHEHARADLAALPARRHFAALLARGLSINATNIHGESPLFYLVTSLPWLSADHCNNPTVSLWVWRSAFEILADAGADFRVRNHAGESVLHKLAQHVEGDRYRINEVDETARILTELWAFLVARGADVGWEDDGRKTCLDVAAIAGAGWVLDIYKRE